MLPLLLLGLALADEPAPPPIADPCALPPKIVRHLDRSTRSEAHEGNAVRLLVNGATSWARRRELAAHADVILVKTFIWTDDEVGRAAAELLAERARAGATVIVQYDFIGSTPTDQWLAAWQAGPVAWMSRAAPFATMTAAGVTVLPTGFPGSRPRGKHAAAYQYDHEKYWITGERQPDGTIVYTAITGGMNIASEYMYGGTPTIDGGTGRGGWRDTDIELRGPVVADVVDRYVAAMEGLAPKGASIPAVPTNPQPPAGDARVRFVWAHPAVGRRGTIERLYRGAIRATPKDEPIAVETAYFAPSPLTLRTLAHAARDGHTVTVISNSAASVDVPFVVDASKVAFASIARRAKEAAFYEWIPAAGLQTLHSKFATFGTCGPVIIGSANLDGLSAEHDSEAVVMVEDVAFRREIAATLLGDLSPERVRAVTADPPRFFLARWWQGALYVVGWYWL
jgi:cardiolipin synthase